MDRRRFLAGVAAATAGAVAGCSDAGDTTTSTSTETDPSMSGNDPTETPTATPTSSGTATPTDTASGTAGTPTDTPADGTSTPTPASDVAAEVTVAAENDLVFAPASVTVQQGETVRWTWAAPGHNVKPSDVPQDSEWTGTPGERSKTFSEGYEYEHTFEVTGTFDYVCVPHEDFGMAGTVVVE